MAGEYQTRRKSPYRIESDNLYRAVLYIIRDYKDMLERREKILYGSPAPPDGLPGSGALSDPTYQKAAILAELDGKIFAIEQTAHDMRVKYADTYTGEPFDSYAAFLDYSIFCYFRSRPDCDMAPSYRTWQRYRSEFVWNVAKKCNFF